MTFGEFLSYLLLIIFAPRSHKVMEWRMLRLLNKDRKRHGLAPVRMQEDLRTVARKHSGDMAQRDFFDHVNLERQSPSDRLRLSRVTDVQSGENLAKIGGYKNPTQQAEIGLMNSPGHRANILNESYNAVGIGVVQSQTEIYYFTQNFAKRLLIFNSRIPHKVRLRKGLNLKGTTLGPVRSIIYQVLQPGREQPLYEGTVTAYKSRFLLPISFGEAGVYEVRIYARKGTAGAYHLCNRFEVKVRKGFWW